MYRAKTVKGDKWVYGYPVPVEIDTYPNGETEMVKSINYDTHNGGLPNVDREEINSLTIGRRMNSTDKHGNDIYAGDVIKTDNEHYKRKTLIVVEHENSFCVHVGTEEPHPIDDKEQPYDMNDFEVIGNIYDNPELKRNLLILQAFGLVYFKDGRTEEVINVYKDGDENFHFWTLSNKYMYGKLTDEECEVAQRQVRKARLFEPMKYGFYKKHRDSYFVTEDIKEVKIYE